MGAISQSRQTSLTMRLVMRKGKLGRHGDCGARFDHYWFIQLSQLFSKCIAFPTMKVKDRRYEISNG